MSVTDTRTAARPPMSGRDPRVAPRRPRNWRRRRRTVAYHVCVGTLSAVWLLPIVLVIVTSFRSFDDITTHGLGSLPHSFTASGYQEAWGVGGEKHAMTNSFLVTIPAVTIALTLSAMSAYALSRYRIPLRRTILLAMLAGNLLPPQILLVPVAKLSEVLGIFDTLPALIAVHVGFGLGFYTFVLQGFMRTIPTEIQEAAIIDGAGPIQVFWRIILPLTRPALAALGALSFTWIFNDLLWSITVLRSDYRMPVTPALLGLQGQYVSRWNLIAAGSVIAAIPTVAVFLRFQRQFVAGLTLGSVK